MSINLSLHDAAHNCERRNAGTVITLRSGVQLRGKLKRNDASMDTWVLQHSDGGWTAFLVEETAAVTATP